jgi:hypothetical protein
MVLSSEEKMRLLPVATVSSSLFIDRAVFEFSVLQTAFDCVAGKTSGGNSVDRSTSA